MSQTETQKTESTGAAKAGAASKGTLNIQLVRSAAGAIPKHRATIKGLGLRRVGHVVSRKDTRPLRGMLTEVSHLIRLVDKMPAATKESTGQITIVKAKKSAPAK